MQYQIIHTTHYSYSHPIALEPHTLRLRPRSDGFQTLHALDLHMTPEPVGRSLLLDLDGNSVVKVWFEPLKTESLKIEVRSQVETHNTNPFNYLLEPWATRLPIDYPSSQLMHLQAFLNGNPVDHTLNIDPTIRQLAQELYQAAAGDTTQFLSLLNQRIYQTCQHQIRETGAPLPPGITWQQQAGSCRDFAVLFMAVCRSVGLAARFVSGYQAGDPSEPERHLHAWAEVYLPGAGWRGYDPTHGLAVADRHIALAASFLPSNTTPVSGRFWGGTARSQLTYELAIGPLP